MKYSSLILASALAFSVGAQSAEGDAASGTKVAMNQTQFSEYRAECIELGISDELTGDQLKIFVDQCIAKKTTAGAK